MEISGQWYMQYINRICKIICGFLFVCGVSVVVFFFLSGEGYCYKPDYGPFQVGEELPLCESHSIPLAGQTVKGDPLSPRTYEITDNGRLITLGVFYDKDLGYAADIVFGERDSEMIPSFAIDGTAFTFIGIYWAYLNEDDKKDFIFMTRADGCGLGASLGYVTFALSTSTGYTIFHSTTWEPTTAEFVMVAGKCRYITTSFIEGLVGKDGRDHNYWLYNLFSFQGDQLVLANHLDRRFPKWVLYTWKPNHLETRQLSSQQKESCSVLAEEYLVE
jgi:hypothetical protein